MSIWYRYKFDLALCVALFAVLGLLTAGCGNRAERMDERDIEHPLMKKARAEEDAGNLDTALSLYQKALAERPDLARAHLELALLYDEPNGTNYLRAIYHYERYLEKRPDTEKKGIVKSLIAAAKMSYAASIPNRPSAAIKKIAKLTKENRLLKERLAVMGGNTNEEQVAATENDTPDTQTSGNEDQLSLPGPEPAASAVDFYTVKKRDTLTKISKKVYNDAGKWRDLYEANRETLESPEALRVGQKLVIPDLTE